MLALNQAGEDLIKGEEDLRLTAYDDANPGRVLKPGAALGGTLTIGWGHTGKDVFIGQTITEEQAERFFQADIGDTLANLSRVIKVPIGRNQTAALGSFAFNIGDGAFNGSTLLRRLNAGDYQAVSKELAKWTKTTVVQGGRKVKIESKGLVRRRAREAELWATPDAGPSPIVSSSAVAEAPDAKPKSADPIVLGGAVAGAGAVLSDVAKQLEPLIGYSDTLKYLFLAVSLVGIAAVVLTRLKNRADEAS